MVELTDNVVGKKHAVEQMIPKIRDVLTNGMIEYGSLGFMESGLGQVRYALDCARRLVIIHSEPFIVGLTDRGITVALMSERNRFIEHASCVVTKTEYWHLYGGF